MNAKEAWKLTMYYRDPHNDEYNKQANAEMPLIHSAISKACKQGKLKTNVVTERNMAPAIIYQLKAQGYRAKISLMNKIFNDRLVYIIIRW